MSSRRSWIRLVGAATALVLGASLVAAAPASAAPDPTLTDAFDAVGTSSIGSINATVPLGPTTLTETLDLLNNNIVSGTLPIPSRQVQFNALGFVPVRATVSLIQASPVTGQLTVLDDIGDLSLTSHVSYTVKISDVSVDILGLWTPVFVGDHCQTINPAAITASTPAGQTFNLSDGGQVTGTYSIGNFSGCSAFFVPGVGSIALNLLVPGHDNTISLNITNGRYVSST